MISNAINCYQVTVRVRVFATLCSYLLVPLPCLKLKVSVFVDFIDVEQILFLEALKPLNDVGFLNAVCPQREEASPEYCWPSVHSTIIITVYNQSVEEYLLFWGKIIKVITGADTFFKYSIWHLTNS